MFATNSTMKLLSFRMLYKRELVHKEMFHNAIKAKLLWDYVVTICSILK